MSAFFWTTAAASHVLGLLLQSTAFVNIHIDMSPKQWNMIFKPMMKTFAKCVISL